MVHFTYHSCAHLVWFILAIHWCVRFTLPRESWFAIGVRRSGLHLWFMLPIHWCTYGSLCLVSFDCHWCSAVMTSPTRMHTLILMVHCCLRAHPHLLRSTLLTFNGEGERKAGALPCLAGALPCLARIYRLSSTNNCNCRWNDPRQRGTALSGAG